MAVTQQVNETAEKAQAATQATISTAATPKPEQIQAARPATPQKTGGLLSRLMKKLLNK